MTLDEGDEKAKPDSNRSSIYDKRETAGPANQEPGATPTVPTKVCPHCSTQSQTASDKCPNCGKPFKVKAKKGGGCLRIIGGLVVGLVVLIIAIAVLSSGLSGGDKDKPKVTKGNGGGTKESTVANVGDNVSLKGTSYKVTKVSTAKAVGGQFTRVKADGTFVIVQLTLKNEKDEPRTILEDAVRLIGGNGSEYTVDTDTLGVFENALVILETIQPGLAKKVVAVYDVPPGAVSGSKLQVKDLFSDSKGEINLGL
jgi:uncharacterized protein DUF4352